MDVVGVFRDVAEGYGWTRFTHLFHLRAPMLRLTFLSWFLAVASAAFSGLENRKKRKHTKKRRVSFVAGLNTTCVTSQRRRAEREEEVNPRMRGKG